MEFRRVLFRSQRDVRTVEGRQIIIAEQWPFAPPSMPGLERFGRRGIFDFELDARADLVHFPVVENLGNVALLLLSQRPTNLCRRPQSTSQFPGRRETVTDQIDVMWSTGNDKLGKASGREQVCQYVTRSGV